MLRADQVRNAVRDDTRFPAACAGQNQHRPFGGFYGFTLLGIETREEIHYSAIFAFRRYMPAELHPRRASDRHLRAEPSQCDRVGRRGGEYVPKEK